MFNQRNPYGRNHILYNLKNMKFETTHILIGINVLIYLIGGFLNLFFRYDINYFFGRNNVAIVSGEIWRLITPMFLHFGILHIAMNMYSLFVLGTMCERLYGTRRFLIIYFVSGFTGNLLGLFMGSDRVLSVGASGAIFGLFGALLFYGYVMKKRGYNPGFLGNMGFIIIINLVYGFRPGSGIDNLGHIGGLFGGVGVSVYFSNMYLNLKEKRLKPAIAVALIVMLTVLAFFAANMRTSESAKKMYQIERSLKLDGRK